MITLQQRINQKLKDYKTPKQAQKSVKPADSYEKITSPEELQKSLARDRIKNQNIPVNQETNLKESLYRGYEYYNPQPGKTRAVDVIREVPGAMQEVASKGVGAVTGLVGAIEGFATGLVGEQFKQSKNVIQGKKYDYKQVWNSAIKSAKDTAKFGYEIGKKGTETAALAPVLAPIITYQAGQGIVKTFSEIGTAYENNKMYGKDSPVMRSTYEGLKSGSSEGWQLMGIDKDTADELSKNDILSAIGNVFLYGSAYLGARGTAYEVKATAEKLPIPKVKVKTVEVPADEVLKRYIEQKLRNTEYRTTFTKDGIEISSPKLKFSEGEIADRVARMPHIKGFFKIEGYEKTPFGRLMSELGSPNRMYVGEFVPEAPKEISGAKISERIPVVSTEATRQPASEVRMPVINEQVTRQISQPVETKSNIVSPEISRSVETPIQTPANVSRSLIPQSQINSRPAFQIVKNSSTYTRVMDSLNKSKEAKQALIDSGDKSEKTKRDIKMLDTIIQNLTKKAESTSQNEVVKYGPLEKNTVPVVQRKIAEPKKIEPQKKIIEPKKETQKIVTKKIETKQIRPKVIKQKVSLKRGRPKMTEEARAQRHLTETRYEEIVKAQREENKKVVERAKNRIEEIKRNQEPSNVIVRKMTEEEKKQYGVDKIESEAKQEIEEIRTKIKKQKDVDDYKLELQSRKARGATQEDFYELMNEEQNKEFSDIDTYLQEYSKSDIIMDFIEENWGFDSSIENQQGKISIKTLLDPIKPIETALNKGAESFLKFLAEKARLPILRDVLRDIIYKTPPINFLGKKIIYEYRLPEWYKELKDIADSEKIKSENLASDIMEYLGKGLTENQKIDLQAAIINRGIHSDPDISARATVARDVLDRYGEQYWKSGAISQETYEANKGTYLPRLYYDYELNKEASNFGTRRGYKATLDRAKKRGIEKIVSETMIDSWLAKGWKVRDVKVEKGKVKIWRDFTKDELKSLGQIIDQPDYLTAKAILQIGNDTAVLRLFQETAKHPDVVSDEPIGDFRKVPETTIQGKKAYGALAGKWVDPYIFEDIRGIIEAPQVGGSMASQFIAHWKTWKIVDNPATHFRNMYFNFILSDIAGLSPFRIDIYGEALRDIIEKRSDFKEARDNGLFGTTWITSGELSRVLGDRKSIKMRQNEKGEYVYDWRAILGNNMIEAVGKLMDVYKKTQGKLSDIYQAEEQWNKLALYKFAKNDLGMNIKDSTKFAKKWGLNYQAISPGINAFSKKWYGVPFIKFQMLAAPRIVEGILFRPFTIMKWLLILTAVEEFSRRTFGLTQSELKRIKRNIFPGWMKEGLYILAPDKDKNGNYQFLDLTYIIPYVQDIKGFNVYNYIYGNPLFRIPAEIMTNRSTLSGQDIYDTSLNPSLTEKTAVLSKYIYQQLAPPAFPGGYNFSKMWDAALQKKDPEGRLTDLVSSVSSSVFGLKLRSLDIEDQTKWRQIELKNQSTAIINKMNSIWRDKGKSESEKKREINKYKDKLQDVYKKALDLSEDSYSQGMKELFEK